MGKEHSPIRFIKHAAQVTALTVLLASCKGGAPTPSLASFDRTLSPVPTKTATPTLTPEPTWPPGPFVPAATILHPTPIPIPTADPNIKCDPRLVPDAKTVVPVNSELPAAFSLHVPILEYHLIDKLKDGKAETDGVAAMSSLVVSPETFDAQMKILHDNGWQTITMAELASYLLQGKTPPDKTFVITFDDGYEDGFINALPILQKYGYVATFYVITNRTGSTSNLTSLQLYQLTQLQNDIGNHSANHTDSTTDATADNEIDSADENIAADAGVWPSTAAYPFGDRYTYEEAVARCITLVMAVIQQPNSNVPEALENKNNRLAVPRIKIWSWVNPDYLLYMLNHLNQNLADNVKLQQGIVIVFPEILDRKEDEEMAA